MPRKSRKETDFPGTIYHIVSHGDMDRRIFRCSQDYKKFLIILKEAKKKFGFYLYSYNLIPNHFHLLIETKETSISKIMHHLNTCYAIYFNHRYHRHGHLFQDRFYSSIITTEFYWWAVSAYIDLNAVRAGLVKCPENYKWSSYQFYARKDYDDDGLIDREKFLRYGGKGILEELRVNYLKFVKEELKNPKRPKFIKSGKFI